MIYTLSDELTETANAVREKHHEDRLEPFKIVWLFTDKAAKKRGVPQWGRVWRPSPVESCFVEKATGVKAHYLVAVARDLWLWHPTKREAAIDSLLCEMENDKKRGVDVPSLRQPDVVAFSSNVQRYGPWTPELKRLRSALSQESFQFEPLEDDDESIPEPPDPETAGPATVQ